MYLQLIAFEILLTESKSMYSYKPRTQLPNGMFNQELTELTIRINQEINGMNNHHNELKPMNYLLPTIANSEQFP